mgnify:CR=1 FL=1
MFKKLVLKTPFQLFLSILLPFLISTMTLLFVQYSFLKQNFEDYALQKIYNQQTSELDNTKRNVQVLTESARSLAITAFFDDMIKDLLYSDVAAEDYVKYQEKVQSYKNIYPFLHSIDIFNGQTVYTVPSDNFVYNRETFPDKNIFSILDDIKNYHSHSIVLREIPNVLSGITTHATPMVRVYSYLFFDTQLQKGKVSDALILNISEDWMLQSIASNDSQKNSRIFMIDSSGRLMTSDSIHPLLSDMYEYSYVQRIISSGEPSGRLRMDVGGIDSFITYTTTDELGWKLINITPYTEIIKEIAGMREKTYLLILIFLLGGILLTFYLSRRLYVPVKLVIRNHNLLESEKKEESYSRKQDVLRKLVKSSDHGPDHSLHRTFQKYNIVLDPHDSFLVFLFKIDHYSELCSKYNSRDRSLLKFGMMNIVSELLSGLYKHECVDVEEDQILVLINFSMEEKPLQQDRLFEIVSEFQRNAMKYLQLSITVTISETFESILDLNFHYLKIVELSSYRMIFGHQAILSESIVEINNEEFKYPQDQEKELTDAMIQGHFQEANRLLFGMIDHASSFSFTVLNSVLIRLLLSIRYAIEVLEANHAIKVNFSFNAYLDKIQKIETLEMIKSDFQELLGHLEQELETKKNHKYINLLEEVTRIIQRDFTNPALSLDTVAEEVGLSSPYLGKLFKKYSNVSMNDYVNSVRLVYATELIAANDETIIEIMQLSGFSSRSHFFTLFKKVHGLTPSQYRNNIKKLERQP